MNSEPAAGTPARPRIADWEVDPALDEIRRGAEVVKLEPRKMQLLMALARRPGELVTTEQLFDEVWKDVVVTQSSVYQSIAQLRRTLGDDTDEPRYIATVPRKGYRLIAAVTAVPMAQPTIAPAESEPTARTHPPHETPHNVRRLWLAGGAAAITISAGLGLYAWRRRPLTASSPIAIAVLPFEDLSPQGLEQALGDGLADDVIGVLSRHARIRVTARTSSFQFRRAAAVNTVAEQLAVTHVLKGEVFRSSDHLRLTVRLYTADGTDVVWRDAIEVPSAAIATLPQRVARDALRALRVPDVPSALAVPAADAYELYLLGRHYQQTATIEGIRKARGYYQRAVDRDAGFALGYVALAASWISEYHFGSGLPVRDMDARAQPLIDRALEIDPDLPEALGLQGHLKSVLNQFGAARPFLQRALAGAPHNASVLVWVGVNEAGDGFPREALQYYTRAAQLNPLHFLIPVRAGLESIHAGLYDDAARHYARAVALAPSHPNTHWGAGIIGFARGKLDDAARGYRQALSVESRREDLWTQLGWIYLDLGLAAQAQDAFAHALALAGSAAQPKIAAARVFLLKNDLRGLAAYLDRNQLPPRGVRDVEIDAALLNIALGRKDLARRSLDAAVGPMLADPIPLFGQWGTFLGHHVPIDVAAVYVALGETERAGPFLDQAQAYIDRYERQGNVWHANSYHRARIAALSGRADTALDALDQAVTLGWRRAWWLRHDPALVSLRALPRFVATVARIEQITAEQRSKLAAT
jgi:DNA-binding winged helix-turn-helix (wHTH) protein/TolB-like protein/Tfp pilus assembly protein PilF